MRPHEGRSDAELVVAAQRGDREAFGDLVARYRDAVYGVAYHALSGLGSAEDLTQDAFVQAYLRLAQLRDPQRFPHWLYVIARNLCRQSLRARRAPLDLPHRRLVADGPEREAAARDLVNRALAALTPDNGLALTLYYINGYTYAEVAEFLNVPTTTVKGRIDRGRRQMREEMLRMMDQHLEADKPGEELGRLVVRRISSAEAWAHEGGTGPPEEPMLLIDGEVAECVGVLAQAGSSLGIRVENSVWSVDNRVLCIFQDWLEPNRYYVFGRAHLEPSGVLIENQVLEASIRVERLEQSAPGLEPWRPEALASAELWAMPPEQRDPLLLECYERAGGPVLIDGHLAHHRLINAQPPGGGTCSGAYEVFLMGRGEHRCNVFRVLAGNQPYYVFGEAEVTPPGFRVANGTVELEAVLEGEIGCVDPGPASDTPRFSCAELWALDPEEQYAQLGGNWMVRLDGRLATVKLTGGQGTNLVATGQLVSTADEPLSCYRLLGSGNRHYVFGRGELQPQGAPLWNEAIQGSVNVHEADPHEAVPPVTPEIDSAQLKALAPDEREGFLQGLGGNVRVLLDGGLAEALLLCGAPGTTCTTPGGEVCFRNVGGSGLHIYLRRWPEPRYFVFGEAEVTPPGLVVRDTVVSLRGRPAQPL